MASVIVRIGEPIGSPPRSPILNERDESFSRARSTTKPCFGLFGEQEALMGAAARYDLSRRVADEHFVHHVFAIALEVAVDDDGAGREPLANHHGCEHVPFLARVQVAVNIRQIPCERVVNGAVENQRRSDGAAERRIAAVPWIVVAGAGDVGRDQIGRDVAGHAAEITAHVHLFAVEKFGSHCRVLRAANFSAWL